MQYDSVFDTYIMLRLIYDLGIEEALSKLDGSFACVLILNEELYIFRNNPGVLYIDDELNISTTEFNNSRLIKKNVILKLDIKSKSIDEVGKFTSISNPYFLL